MSLRIRTNRRLVATIAALAFAILTSIATSALAAEARPWLCRDKPVFSATGPIAYQADNRGGSVWRLFFMHFEMGGENDGYTTVDSRVLRPGASTSGTLSAGQYFAVAMYRVGGGRWICSGPTDDSESPQPGEISRICYSSDSSDCAVKLTPRHANPTP